MKYETDSRRHMIYVICMILAWGLSSLLVLAANIIIDPLWYHRGNLITGKNFGYDERQAKLNRLLREPSEYDCLIFGSSRTTLLPGSAFAPYRCFNLSFSGGLIEEFIAFSEYLREFGVRPKLIVVGVDGFNFMVNDRDPPSIPDYVIRKQPAPALLRTYLSIDSLSMSWRTLRGDTGRPRYYDRNFDAVIRADAPVFRPRRSLDAEGLRRVDTEAWRKRGYSPDNAILFGKLVTVFPGAQSIAYVPPISAWHVRAMEQNGTLESYLDALHATARNFPVFVDFSIPSPVTWRTDNTYDGSHYAPSVNRRIAHVILTADEPEWGLNVNQVDRASYVNRYRSALAEFETVNAMLKVSQ
ncbi:hypothetical protein [Aromatoleum anaerobium]|uniref:DUF1574 domain-containing protein n=1 Tax=Aromatoleum anaerobium TaxID=182180 RepID=A0ABX1PH32_9RHOO|nr:hypothetical protein [Aromatoleum anaerobium]MCK0509201.1 hypothetical protein [Aromatoleum anaerobium]